MAKRKRYTEEFEIELVRMVLTRGDRTVLDFSALQKAPGFALQKGPILR